MRYLSGDYDQLLVADARPQRFLGGAALSAVALLCAWTLCTNLIGNGSEPIDWASADTDQSARSTEVYLPRGDKLAIARPMVRKIETATAALFDPHFLGFRGEAFFKAAHAMTSPAQPSLAQVRPEALSNNARLAEAAPAAVPLPPAPPLRIAALHDNPRAPRAAANAAPEEPSLFERLFGKPARVALAYAAPDTAGLETRSLLAGRYDRQTAVYDISAHRVYMPDGSVLEAHSGYGGRLDDPHSADVRNLGVTPPNMYDLEPRDSLFHGVQALRLIPADDEKVFGRSGLLAHSYMLGPNGQSNGCVSFRDYDAFLRAYLNHEVKRLAVVTRLQ